MKAAGRARLRLLPSVLASFGLTACGTGIDAGVDGGVAFIGFTVMLIVTGVILYLALGRED